MEQYLRREGCTRIWQKIFKDPRQKDKTKDILKITRFKEVAPENLVTYCPKPIFCNIPRIWANLLKTLLSMQKASYIVVVADKYLSLYNCSSYYTFKNKRYLRRKSNIAL